MVLPAPQPGPAALRNDGHRSPSRPSEKDLDAKWERSATLDAFAFVSQLSSCSTCSTVGDLASGHFFSRQCTEIDMMAQVAWSESALEDAVRAATADCRFSATVADPRRSDFPLIAVSEAFEAMTHFKREEVLGKNCRFLNYGCDMEPEKMTALREACATGAPFTAVLQNRRKAGELFLNFLDLRGLTVARDPSTGEELWFLVGIQADVSGLAEADYPEDHLLEMSLVAAAIRERITRGLSSFAVAGALAAEASAPRLAAEPQKTWYPLPEPRWHTGPRLLAMEVPTGKESRASSIRRMKGPSKLEVPSGKEPTASSPRGLQKDVGPRGHLGANPLGLSDARGEVPGSAAGAVHSAVMQLASLGDSLWLISDQADLSNGPLPTGRGPTEKMDGPAAKASEGKAGPAPQAVLMDIPKQPRQKPLSAGAEALRAGALTMAFAGTAIAVARLARGG
mmetsp:Transcript_104554/g.326050  ORF Transcript_104554/g.326050 Transcript_104554/m.326050 type:complete len:453 (-) Transcript_104554:78-1436(-)